MCRTRVAIAKRWIACFLALGVLAAAPARSGVSISLDAEALNALLPVMAPEEIQVPMGPQGNTVRLRLSGLKVTGFEPASAQSATGRILTSLRIQAPQLNLDLPTAPRIIVTVEEEAGGSVLVLHFENLLLPLLGASIDVSSLLPPLRFPVAAAFPLQTPRGEVPFESRVTSVSVGSRYVRFDFDLRPAAGH